MKKFIYLILIILLSLPMIGCKDSEIVEAGDIDMSALNSELVFAQLTRINSSKKSYVGNNIKIKGTHKIDYNDGNVVCTHCIYIIFDACCEASIEFVWEGEHASEDYPREGAILTIEGVYSTYVEDDVTHYCIMVKDCESLL